jgi:hypothetical protein
MSIRTNSISAAAAAWFVLLVAPPATAVDGEILINQAKANAGGITPGDAVGFPATLSRRGRYKLIGSLAVPAGKSGIEVTQSDVTIDLNGFTISSNPPGEALTGVYANDVIGLRLTNGSIIGFKNEAISNYGGLSKSTVIENMRLISNTTGFLGTRDAQIRNSIIADSRLAGINCYAGCLIEQNVITGSTESFGIATTGGGALVLGNVIVSNKLFGLGVDPSGQSTGYGGNVLYLNNAGGPQVSGPTSQLHPNVCEPVCP